MATNQCDGCLRGLVTVDGIHHESADLPWSRFGCTRHLYEETPVKTTIDPDYMFSGTSHGINKEFAGFKFNGPGFYETPQIPSSKGVMDVMLVVPRNRGWYERNPNFWAQSSSETEIFDCYIWSSTSISQIAAIFNIIVNAPHRE